MAIDYFVMPLCRFFAGDFSTAAQRITAGNMRRVILSDDVNIVSPTASVSSLDRWWGKQKTRDLKRRVFRITGESVDWNDKGEIIASSQYHHDEVLNLYIAWCSLRGKLPSFETLHPYNHPGGHPGWDQINALGKWNAIYPHLYGLGFANTISIPCHLPAPAKIWPSKKFYGIIHTTVFSTPHALQEINHLCNELGIDENYDAWKDGWEDRDTPAMANLKEGASIMRNALRVANEHQLPLIFW